MNSEDVSFISNAILSSIHIFMETIIRNLAFTLISQIKSWQLSFPSHLNDDTTKQECAPGSMALVVCRHCNRGQWPLLL